MLYLAHLFRTPLTALALLFAICATATAATYTVTNANDGGAGSLRQAILDANATPGSDTINFSIGSGVQTISPLSPLPTITAPVSLDATTQPGYSGSPLIELNGTSAGSNSVGIRISAGSSIVQGFVINRFHDQIVLETGGGNRISGNFIGTDVNGTSASGFSNFGILISGSSDNLIGGTTTAARNVISGGNFVGINILNTAPAGNQVQGNFIGTTAPGTASLGNRGSGILVSGPNNIIGGTATGARNIISANNDTGVEIFSLGAGSQVQGNYIGIDVTGTVDLGNRDDGVSINGANVLIGGTVAEARNVISGNGANGLLIGGSLSTGTQVQGNYIGTNATGNISLGNSRAGVHLLAAAGNTIGGTTAGAGNVISGNFLYGVEISGNPTSDPSQPGNQVQGNFIGTNAEGTARVANLAHGIQIFGARNNLIGGTVAGARNLISGNTFGSGAGGNGILLDGGASGNVLQGNFIGTDINGSAPIPNAFHGVAISNASGNTVGGAASGAGNVIAYNGLAGVSVATNTSASGFNNQIRGNSIFSNSSLGIDLGFDGATPNDAGDPDAGANNLQNFPIVRTVTTGAGSTNAQGTLNSAPNASYVIELFANNSCDPSAHGEGQVFLGATTANTDASGNAAFSVTFPVQLAPGQVVTATATDASGNTSEFSVCNEVNQPGRIQFSSSTYTTTETGGSVVITVVRTLGTADTASVNYATSDGSATANSDYTPTSGTLVFASGETTKTFTVQILNDTLGETTETINLTLSNPSGSTLGSPSAAVINVQDDEPIPDVNINSVSVNEETLNSGASAIFTVRLSAASANTVTVRYSTADNTAVANVDYTPVSGQVTFTPGQTTRTISVPIISDTLDEENESFFLLLTEATNANIQNGFGVGTIFDNDPDPGTTGELLITEFRSSGPGGTNDEFVELYNNTNANIDLRNYSLVFYTGIAPTVLSFSTLQGATLIPPRAHRLLVNSSGYSLAAYGSGSFIVTSADFFADNQGIALRRNGTAAHVDAVGFTDDPVDFREGTGLAVISEFPAIRPQYSYVRKLTSGVPQDTGDNASDFTLVTTTGEMMSGVPSVLGAPGPQGQVSPVQRNAAIKSSLIDALALPSLPPNRVRTGSATGVNAAYGTITLRRRFTNTTGTTVTRLRFRVVDITTLGSPNPTGNPQADLRVLDSTDTSVETSAGTITVKGTLIEQPPAQPLGGGLNSSLSVVLPAGGLPNGSSLDVQFVLGVQQEGNFRFFVNVEALPAPTVANPGAAAGKDVQKSEGGKMSNDK